MSKIQDRYVQYARSQGRTPDDQLKHDTRLKPVAPMLLYMEWVSDQITQYYVSIGRKRRPGELIDQAAIYDFIEKGILQGPEKDRILAEENDTDQLKLDLK